MRIGIVGLGLMGGSLAMDLRSLSHKVFGVSRQEETCKEALKRGIVNYSSTDLSLLSETEIIFICTPLEAIAPTVKKLIPFISPNTILTDVGSVKKYILDSVSPLWDNFIGGHPMAGTTDSGLAGAITQLFINRYWCITPTEKTPPKSMEILTDIITSLRAKVCICDPEEHDRAVALISHLPVMISSTLISSCLTEKDENVLNLAKMIASSGFRDTSRVGGGNPELGLMMAKYNREFLLHSLTQYRDKLDELISKIEKENWRSLEQDLQSTQQNRSEFLICK